MCRWMGSHFHEWIDNNGVAHFPIFGGKTVLHIYGYQTYQNVCTVGGKESVLYSIYTYQKVTKLGLRKFRF